MSSSEPVTSSAPEVGGQNVESVVYSSTEGKDGGMQTRRDGGTQTRRDCHTQTRPQLHPISKKRKVNSTDEATPSSIPFTSNLEDEEEDAKDKDDATECNNRKPSRLRSWTWDHFTKDPKSKPSHPKAKS
ncbi:hypothetical protein PIB30_023159 [Stylosanthes scabra]|uniref:Uncharacterized protein n=1 Tax=Stylosanthes scabra TaxID=79078 RepID=A0ABU6S991_9FABA|nr:hypothetical protein [Stylosanthes scabra]